MAQCRIIFGHGGQRLRQGSHWRVRQTKRCDKCGGIKKRFPTHGDSDNRRKTTPNSTQKTPFCATKYAHWRRVTVYANKTRLLISIKKESFHAQKRHFTSSNEFIRASGHRFDRETGARLFAIPFRCWPTSLANAPSRPHRRRRLPIQFYIGTRRKHPTHRPRRPLR